MKNKAKLPANWRPCEVNQLYMLDNTYTVNNLKGSYAKYPELLLCDETKEFVQFLKLYGDLPTKQTKKGKLPANWRPVQKVNSDGLYVWSNYELYVKDWTEYDTHKTIEEDNKFCDKTGYLENRLFYMLYRNVKLS